jgi:hypothetical protein
MISGRNMKNLLLLLSLAIILIINGCSHNEPSSSSIQGEKIAKQIPLPEDSTGELNHLFFDTEVIDGHTGGILLINESYHGINGMVHIKLMLKIPVNAFEGTETITAQVNDQYAEVDFSPTMVFENPPQLDLTFTGLDLSGVDPDLVDFVYLAPDGSTQSVQRDSLGVGLSDGTIYVKKALINHFSRYIFTRKVN